MSLFNYIFRSDSDLLGSKHKHASSQQIAEIMAHYDIQLKKEKKRLMEVERENHLKLQELESKVKNSAQNKDTINVKLEQSLQMELYQKKREVETLQKKLANLKKRPFNILNNVDEALIPHESAFEVIDAKKREIKLLTNELSLVEEKFQGKYFTEHKLVNEYEVELAMNKKLKQEIQQSHNIRQQYRIESEKRAMKNISNKRIYQKTLELQGAVEELRQKIKEIESQEKKREMKGSRSSKGIEKIQIENLRLELKQVREQNQSLESEKKKIESELHEADIEYDELQEEHNRRNKERAMKYHGKKQFDESSSDSDDLNWKNQSNNTVRKDDVWKSHRSRYRRDGEFETEQTKKNFYTHVPENQEESKIESSQSEHLSNQVSGSKVSDGLESQETLHKRNKNQYRSHEKSSAYSKFRLEDVYKMFKRS